MTRQEDFIDAGIAYRMKHGKLMCIAGSNFADVEMDLNRVMSFEEGAEYGYQYALQHPHWIPIEDSPYIHVVFCKGCNGWVPFTGYGCDISSEKTVEFINCINDAADVLNRKEE